MKTIKETYNGIKEFVDNFSNSTTHQDYSPHPKENAPAWYAEWDDNYIGSFVENPITRQCLRTIADHYYADQFEAILSLATELTEFSYPTLCQVYAECCDALGLYQRPTAYVTSRLKGINALSVEVKRKKVVLISVHASMRLTPEEQSFLIGHELGHHQQGNLVCHTVNGLIENLNSKSEIFGPIVSDAIEVPLKRWCRCSEFNADRAGYICCKELDVVKSLFEKLGMRQTLSPYGEYKEVGSSHPSFQTRLEKISEYTITPKPTAL